MPVVFVTALFAFQELARIKKGDVSIFWRMIERNILLTGDFRES
jgi:hypothetical protein